jgi:hypothetical protein
MTAVGANSGQRWPDRQNSIAEVFALGIDFLGAWDALGRIGWAAQTYAA